MVRHGFGLSQEHNGCTVSALLALCWLVCTVGTGFAQVDRPRKPDNDFEPPVGRDEGSPRESPGHFRLLTARSADGLTFIPTGQVISDQANVPDLIYGPGGAIHLYYTGAKVGRRYNTLALAISRDQGRTWTFRHVEIEGKGLEHAGDPDIARLEDGSYRLFLTTMIDGRHAIAYCDGADGIHFTHRGTAFADKGLDLLDSTTFRLGDMWHMLTLEGRGMTQRHGTSADGKVFEVGQPTPFVVEREPYIAANGVATKDGHRIFAFSPRARGFRSFVTQDGRTWKAEEGIRLAMDQRSSLGGAQIKDPTVLRLADGSYLMVYVARLPEEGGDDRRDGPRPQGPDRRHGEGERGPGLPRGRGPSNAPEPAGNPNAITDWGAHWSQGRAAGKGSVRFTHSPMRVEDIERILPYGLMVGGHVCPIDHGYFYPKPLPPGGAHYDVLAPADGFVVMVSHRTQLAGSTEKRREYDDYALILEHSGTFYTQYDLLTKLDAKVLDQLDESGRQRFSRREMGPPIHTRIAVKAGQVIGKVGGRSLDFGVINTEQRLAGFLTPRRYGPYAWRIHMADPFDFFDNPLKSKLLELNVRKTRPFFGKIDYDVDGRLIGNWFFEGSGGYPGDRRDPRGYWMGHLAFAYHHIDLAKIVISIGDFGGKPAQFWIKNNAPDPAKIGEKDGPVKFELIRGQLGNDGSVHRRHDGDEVQGTVLVQVLPERKLKFEAFPGKTGKGVEGFTASARTYER